MAVSLCGAAPPSTGLTADLTERLVRITTGFSGAHITVFGAIDGGGDIIVVVRGPAHEMTVREKRDVAGVWLNRHSVRIGGVPAYYAVMSTKPPRDILPPAQLAENEIGFDAIKMEPQPGLAEDITSQFEHALIRDLTDHGLYRAPATTVTLLDGRLFKTTLDLPATVPIGDYTARVILVRHGAIIDSQTLPLTIAETGMEATIRAVSNGDPLLYGLLAIFAAAATGWLGNLVLRGSR